ncbi:MAG TPA: hypothetical protein VFG15_15605 [Amycolatopsis sp.]|nr:hypothetical protein [Amycolatopsis sp.]
MYERTENGLKLELELGGDPPEACENADGWVTLPDGSRWTATFLSYAELGRILDRWKVSGECLNGTYFTCPDLVLIREPGVRNMFSAVQDLVADGGHALALGRVG